MFSSRNQINCLWNCCHGLYLLSRCVIVVGLPYPSVKSAELREKMDYLNSHMVSFRIFVTYKRESLDATLLRNVHLWHYSIYMFLNFDLWPWKVFYQFPLTEWLFVASFIEIPALSNVVSHHVKWCQQTDGLLDWQLENIVRLLPINDQGIETYHLALCAVYEHVNIFACGLGPMCICVLSVFWQRQLTLNILFLFLNYRQCTVNIQPQAFPANLCALLL